MKKLKSDINDEIGMKLKSIGGPKGGFYFESAYVDEDTVKILFSDEKNKILGRILVKGVIHFQRTDESYKIDTFFDLVAPTPDKKNPLFLSGECFFEVLDKKYTEWVLKDHYFPLDDDCKMYVLFFSESYIEILSYDPPVFSKVRSKQEYYSDLSNDILS